MSNDQPTTFCSDHWISRIFTQNEKKYIAHYLPHQAEAFKVSPISCVDEAKKYHQNFVFFAKFQASYQKTSKKRYELDEPLRHLIEADSIINLVNNNKWTNKQLGLYENCPDPHLLPDCEFTYIREQYYALSEKCHTDIYNYQIQNGLIILLDKSSENF